MGGPPGQSVGVGYTFVKQWRVFSIECAAPTMARFRVVHWKNIPSVVEAADDEQTVRHQLSQKFQDLIDSLAMRDNATEEDAYLEGWGQGEWEERPGSAEAVAQAVAADIENDFQTLLMQRFLPKPS